MSVELVRFATNVREELSFTHASGNETEGMYGTQYYRSTTDGRGVYLQPIVERKLIDLQVKPGEVVSIGKVEVKDGRKKGIQWEVKRIDPPGQPSDVSQRPTEEPRVQNEAPQPAATNGINAAEPKPRGHQQGNGTIAELPKKPVAQETQISHTVIGTLMKACLCAAIDAARDAQMYATNHGFPLTFSADQVQDLASTIFIQQSKHSNILLMNERQQPRAANGGTSWPQ